MMRIDIPGWQTLELSQLVLDLNGTLALDGQILPGLAERLRSLSADLTLYLVTADTLGTAEESAQAFGAHLVRVLKGEEAGQKAGLVLDLGAGKTAAIGNGANDARMLSEAALGIAVLGREGLAVAALLAADVLAPSIEDALDLLLQPARLIATLRR